MAGSSVHRKQNEIKDLRVVTSMISQCDRMLETAFCALLPIASGVFVRERRPWNVSTSFALPSDSFGAQPCGFERADQCSGRSRGWIRGRSRQATDRECAGCHRERKYRHLAGCEDRQQRLLPVPAAACGHVSDHDLSRRICELQRKKCGPERRPAGPLQRHDGSGRHLADGGSAERRRRDGGYRSGHRGRGSGSPRGRESAHRLAERVQLSAPGAGRAWHAVEHIWHDAVYVWGHRALAVEPGWPGRHAAWRQPSDSSDYRDTRSRGPDTDSGQRILR